MEKQRFSRKVLNICAVLVIIVAIVFIAMMFVLHYDVNGETNMPFSISKISIISTVDGQDVENNEYRWDINAIQNNDIYIYVEKNNEYRKQELISSVKIENIKIKKEPIIGKIKIYKPTAQSDTAIFKNVDENIVQELVFSGGKITDARNLQVSNQGGVICFRCANNEVGKYLSNDDEQIDYSKLLYKMNINEGNLKAVISFNVTITLNSGKSFKTEEMEIEIPNENIVNNGTVGIEKTNLSNIIFKRIEN